MDVAQGDDDMMMDRVATRPDFVGTVPISREMSRVPT